MSDLPTAPAALVTGASGFIGSAVVRSLLDGGHSVRALVEPGRDDANLAGLADRAHRRRHPRRRDARPRGRPASHRVPPRRDLPLLGAPTPTCSTTSTSAARMNVHRARMRRSRVPAARVHEHGRDARRRRDGQARVGAFARALRASLRALQAVEVPRRARGAARGRGRAAGRARAPDVPGGRGRLRADADRSHDRRVPQRPDPGLRRHRAQRRARRRRRPRSRARGRARRAGSELHPRRREHVAARDARDAGRAVRAAGAAGPRLARSSCCRSCAAPSGSQATVLRREPTLPSEPVRMATTRMEYDDQPRAYRARIHEHPCARGAAPRRDAGTSTTDSSRPAGRADPRARAARARTLDVRADAQPAIDARRRCREPCSAGAVRSRRRARGAAGRHRRRRGRVRRARAARAARRRGVRAPRAVHEPADAAHSAHDRLRPRLRARRGRVPLRPRRQPLPRLPRRVRRVRARPLPSGDRAGVARRDGVRAAEPRADGVRAALGPARRSAGRRACPNDDYRCFFTNSGAESVETVLKFVRCATATPSRAVRRPRVPRAHHRRAVAQRRARVPRPLRRRCCPGARACRSAISTRCERELAAGDVAAFVVEPIQGKGVFVAPDGLSARSGRALPPATARCSRSTRCRPGSVAPARSSRSSSGTSSPTS